jgi:hypothetical protein
VTVAKTVWYAGLKVTVGTVSYSAARRPSLIADVRLDNQSTHDYDLSDLDVSVKSDNQFTVGRAAESNPVPALAASDYHLEFQVGRLGGGLGAATIFLGKGNEAQAVVPVGAGELIANEPRIVIHDLKVTHRDLVLTVTTCEVRADFVGKQRQTAKDQQVLGCFLDVRFTGRGLHWFRTENMRLRLPDGTSISAAVPPYELMQDGSSVAGVYVGFTFKASTPGSYLLQVVDAHGDEAPAAANTYAVPFTI